LQQNIELFKRWAVLKSSARNLFFYKQATYEEYGYSNKKEDSKPWSA